MYICIYTYVHMHVYAYAIHIYMHKIGALELEKFCKINNVVMMLKDMKDFCCLDLKCSAVFCFTTFC